MNPDATLPGWTARQAADAPDAVGLVIDNVPITNGELWERANRAAAGLREVGIGAGDRFAIYMENRREFVELWIGGMLLGALAVPINLAYQGEFLRYQLAHSGARLVAVDDSMAQQVAAVADGCPALETVLVRGGSSPTKLPGIHTDAVDCLFTGGAGEADFGLPANDTAATIIYTSGTTGRSKGVVLSHHYLAAIGSALVDAQRLTAADTVYIPLPLFHLSGMSAVLTSAASGCTGVIDRRFTVTNTWDRVRTLGCTGAVFVGPMIAMLWNLPAADEDATLGLRFLGGAPIPAGMEDALRARYRCDLVTLLGMTEVFPIAAARAGEQFPSGSSGRANPAFDLRIVDDDGRDVPAGTPGELVVRSHEPHTMFEGYFADEAATAAQFRDGWFFTGDLGRVDDDGFVYFVDRKKDAIRRRGENISSLELEAAIRRHPHVADVAVHGVPSEFGEEEVKAVVVASDPTLTPETLADFCGGALPSFAVPRYIELVESLPRNPVGRILKYELRERGVTDATFDREARAKETTA